MTMTDAEKRKMLQEIVMGERPGPTTCILCKNHGIHYGFFVPYGETHKQLGLPAGKIGICLYALCDKCVQKPNKEHLVEQSLLDERKTIN